MIRFGSVTFVILKSIVIASDRWAVRFNNMWSISEWLSRHNVCSYHVVRWYSNLSHLIVWAIELKFHPSSPRLDACMVLLYHYLNVNRAQIHPHNDDRHHTVILFVCGRAHQWLTQLANPEGQSTHCRFNTVCADFSFRLKSVIGL